MRLLGIDTDSKGCVALLDDQAHTLDLYYIPTTESSRGRAAFDRAKLASYFRHIFTLPVDHVYFEEQWSRKDQSSVATFTFGDVYGSIIQAVESAAFYSNQAPEYHYVSGREWKGKLGLSSHKGYAVQLADKVFPGCVKGWEKASRQATRSGKYTSGAESALLAFYGSVLQRNRVRLPSNLDFYAKIELGKVVKNGADA